MDAATLRQVGFALVLASFMWTAPASAQDLSWPEEHRRVGAAEAVVIGGSAAGIAAVRLLWGEPESPSWIGPILLDDAVRSAFYEDGKDVSISAALSDVLLYSLLTHTIVIDSVGITGLANDEWDSAFQMSTIATQSHLLNILVTTTLKNLVARQRPGFGGCYEDPESDESCAERPNVSFPSGHTSSAFTGAGLVCVTHEFMPIYGGTADRLACWGAIGVATATGLLRISSNNHYLSDIFAGGVLGFAMGYVLPRVVYFGDAKAEPEVGIMALEPRPAPPMLLQLSGAF